MILYDLVNAQGAHFSPNSWRVRMALLHKGLKFEVHDKLFTEIPGINPGGDKLTIPTIHHEGRLVTDSWAIVEHLDQAFPATPRLIAAGAEGQVLKFFQFWVQTALHAGVARSILLDVHDSLDPADRAYFRSSREKLYKQTLEEVQAGREQRLDAFRKSLQPMRLVLGSTHPFIGGSTPCYADYLVFGAFQWARVSSRFQLLAEDDAVHAWFERCLDLYDGAARREPAA
jgi:glutathione S-transferase